MKKIRFEDISVGDWIEAGDNVKLRVKYPRNRHDMITVEYLEPVVIQAMTFTETTIGIEDARPIPIAPEILKANGFSCVEVGDKGPATPKAHYMRYERWRIETQWGYRDLLFDRMTKRYKLDGMNEYTFTEVHKLQHALRFSGFDKEILL